MLNVFPFQNSPDFHLTNFMWLDTVQMPPSSNVIHRSQEYPAGNDCLKQSGMSFGYLVYTLLPYWNAVVKISKAKGRGPPSWTVRFIVCFPLKQKHGDRKPSKETYRSCSPFFLRFFRTLIMRSIEIYLKKSYNRTEGKTVLHGPTTSCQQIQPQLYTETTAQLILI